MKEKRHLHGTLSVQVSGGVLTEAYLMMTLPVFSP